MASKEDLEKQIKDLEAKLTEATVSNYGLRNKLVYYKPEKLRRYDGLSDVTEWIDDCKAAFTEGYSDIEKVMNHLSGQAKRGLADISYDSLIYNFTCIGRRWSPALAVL